MNLRCHGFCNHDLQAIYELVNLIAVEELQRGILLESNWPESILSDALVQVASFEQSRLVFQMLFVS